MQKNNFNINYGFTLAEVIVVLGIIGVIAAIIIPPFVKKYEQQQMLIRYKKVYSEISQALKSAEVDNGSIEEWDFTTSVNKTQDFADKFLYPYLRIAKKCDFNEDGCWKSPVSLSNTSSNRGIASTRLSAITSSGYSLLFWVSGTGNSAFIDVDINGPDKGQNKLGVDVFIHSIFFTSSGNKAEFKTYGMSPIPKSHDELINASYVGCKKFTGATSGAYCSSLIVVDGWQISTDYPWN